MGNNLSTQCEGITTGQYCSAPWQTANDKWCGLCPSPAITGYGTLGGLTLSSSFTMLTICLMPEKSAALIMDQVRWAHMVRPVLQYFPNLADDSSCLQYLFSTLIRYIMAYYSNGVNSHSRYNLEFAFLNASAIVGVVTACALSDTHHLHGFSSARKFNEYLLANLDLKQARLSAKTEERIFGEHKYQLQEKHLAEPSDSLKERSAKFAQRLRKFNDRHQAALGTSVGAIWRGKNDYFWQPDAEDHIPTVHIALIRGVSFTFVGFAILATLFLIVPTIRSPSSQRTISQLHKRRQRVPHPDPDRAAAGETVDRLHPTKPAYRVESAAGFIVRLFHHHEEVAKSAARRVRKGKGKKEAPMGVRASSETLEVPEDVEGPNDPGETSAEKRVKYVISAIVWFIWCISIWTILKLAIDSFLLIGVAWAFAVIQNFMFGLAAPVNFFFTYLRPKFLKPRHKARVARRSLDDRVRAGGRGARRDGEREEREREDEEREREREGRTGREKKAREAERGMISAGGVRERLKDRERPYPTREGPAPRVREGEGGIELTDLSSSSAAPPRMSGALPAASDSDERERSSSGGGGGRRARLKARAKKTFGRGTSRSPSRSRSRLKKTGAPVRSNSVTRATTPGPSTRRSEGRV
ncbi:hypothetical protein JCM8097_006218 [Rhodosporidiobolus ruineniae]